MHGTLDQLSYAIAAQDERKRRKPTSYLVVGRNDAFAEPLAQITYRLGFIFGRTLGRADEKSQHGV